MKKMMKNVLVMVAAVAGCAVFGAVEAKAAGLPLEFPSLSQQILGNTGANDAGINVPQFTLEDYQDKTTMEDVKDSFSNSMGSLGEFFGNIFKLMTQYKLFMPALLLAMGVRALFKK